MFKLVDNKCFANLFHNGVANLIFVLLCFQILNSVTVSNYLFVILHLLLILIS
jgi:hypothetical protein